MEREGDFLMKLERTKNTSRNIVWGLLQQFFNIVFPILLRGVFIRLMPVQYMGLSSLFSSIFSIIGIAELGFGGAMIACMYKPIAEDDQVTLNAMYKLYRDIYRLIGTVILLGGLIAMLFLESLTNGECPDGVNMYVIYLMYLFNGVFSYWSYAYKNSVLMAYQRYDIGYKRTMYMSIFSSLASLMVLLLTKNIYIYTIITPINTVITNIWTSVAVNKLYPECKCEGKVSKEMAKEIKKKVFDVFCSKIGYQVQGTIATFSLTKFMNLTAVALYNNYFFVQNTIFNMMGVFFTAVRAGLGNLAYTDGRTRNYEMLQEMQFISGILGGWCSACLLCLYQPFIAIWLGNDYVEPFTRVIFLVILFYVRTISTPVRTYKDALGLWSDEKIKPLVACITNLLISIIVLKFTKNVNGVIIAAIISYGVISLPWETRVLFREYFQKSEREYYKGFLNISIVSLFIAMVFLMIVRMIPGTGIISFVLQAMIVSIGAGSAYVLIYRKNKYFKRMIQTVVIMLPIHLKKHLNKLPVTIKNYLNIV